MKHHDLSMSLNGMRSKSGGGQALEEAECDGGMLSATSLYCACVMAP
jgi:hypothetical protein